MKKQVPVYGMHCKACELLIENRLGEIDGVTLKKISQNENYIEIDIKNQKNLEEVVSAIKELGYHTSQKQVKSNTPFDYIIIFLTFIIFGILYLLFKDVKLFENVAEGDNVSFLVVLLIGLVASLSSCLAVTGGIVIGFAKYMDTSKSTYSHLKTQTSFHLGRIIGFAILGGILGSIGGFLGSFGFLNTFLLGLAGIFMLYMGLNMMGFVKFKLSLPKVFGSKILSIKNPAFAPIVGALTFFLPCGFTQSMQVYAASSGSFFSGALIMGIFALGTMPVLFLVGFGSSYFKDKDFHYINKIIGVLVVYFALFILSGFYNLIHISTKSTGENTNINYENISFEQKTVFHNGWTLEEKEVYLKAGENYKLNIIPQKNGIGCMTTLTIPGIDNQVHRILSGVPIGIHIVDAKPGKYNIVCSSMGMKQGEIIIE